MSRLFIGILLCLFSSSVFAADMRTGVIRVELNKFKGESALKVYNSDGSLFATVYKDEEEGEYKVKDASKKINTEILKDVRAYYLDYGLLIFDAETVQNGSFPVFIGSQTKYIKASEIKTLPVSYQAWSSFFKDVFIKTGTQTSIVTDTVSKKKIANAEQYSYSIKQIKGDWAYVECLKTCEQCPKGSIVKGWVKWRDKNTLLVKLFYFC